MFLIAFQEIEHQNKQTNDLHWQKPIVELRGRGAGTDERDAMWVGADGVPEEGDVELL